MIMRKSLLLYVVTTLVLLTSCVNDGGQVFGELPEGLTITGDKLEVGSVSYDDKLNELRINWKTTPGATYRGVEVTFKTLSGGTKTVRILADSNFPSSYSYFTVVTGTPKDVNFRCIWNEEGAETVSEWITSSDLNIKTESATKRFVTLQMPTFSFIDEYPGTAASSLYNQIVGESETAKKSYYSDKLKTVISAAYFSTADAGERPVSILQCYFAHMELEGAVAYVSANSQGPLMKMSYEYVKGLADSGGANADNIFEINGVILHEFAHLIQGKPKAATSQDYDGCIEGYADAIRCAAGGVTDANRIATGLGSANAVYHDPNRTEAPYIWQTKYGTSGYFMSWLRYYDGDFLRKLTASMNKLESNWTLEIAIKYILGENFRIKDLWEEYINDVQKEAASKKK